MSQLPPRVTPSDAPRINVESSGSGRKKWVIGGVVALIVVAAIAIGAAVGRSTGGEGPAALTSTGVETSSAPSTTSTSTASTPSPTSTPTPSPSPTPRTDIGTSEPSSDIPVSEADANTTSNVAPVAPVPAPPPEPVGKTDAGTPEALLEYFTANASCPPDGTAWPQWTGPSDFIIGVPEVLQPLYNELQDGFYNASSQEYSLRFQALPENLTYCSQPVTLHQNCSAPMATTGTLQQCGTPNGTEMWSHNPSSNLCEPFTYNGCGGNSNLFYTQALCAMNCETPVKATVGGTISFQKNGKCAPPPAKPDGSPCCRIKFWQPNYAGYYYDDCAAQINLGDDGVYFFKTEIPGSELSAGWGPDPMAHIHYDILCQNCTANEYFEGEYRYWNKFYPQEICEIDTCWGEGSKSGPDISLAATQVHKAQIEEYVNDELRFTYHMALPPGDANITLTGKPTEY